MQVNPQRLEADVRFLAEIRPFRNYKNPESLDRAAKYIEEQFRETGLTIDFQTWSARKNSYKNIIASLYPQKEKRLIVGAHYDVYYNQPGADDNASGVAGLLATARLVVGKNPSLDYGIDFVAYCLEEPPFFRKKEMGSFVHAKSLFDKKTKVIGMICYEMIGYYGGSPEPEKYFNKEVTYDFLENEQFVGVISTKKYRKFHRRFWEAIKAANPRRVGFVSFPDSARGPSLSDNRNYWYFGYPALMLNDAPSGSNPHYHQKTDTPDTLDFEIMAEVVEASSQAILKF